MSADTEQGTMPTDEDCITLDEAGDVRLPIVELLTGRGFITGKSGSGKSNSASVVAEELLSRGFPLMVVDTDGEYWGLKEEYEILHVGADEECDLQVGAEHAEKLASLALEDGVPIILDVSGYLDKDAANAVVREVAHALFTKEKKLKQPFLMLVEEIHEYIPEGGGLGDVGQMLVKIGKRGRKHGLGIAGISQRPADVKKDFITQANWMLWHRLTWDNDTSVVRRVVDSDTADAVQDLADGEAFLMADFLDADIQRVQVRRKQTFDAGATPDLDDFERPDLKSVSEDLVGELEEISEQEQQRQDRIAELEARLEDREAQIDDLQQQLENQEDIASAAQQMAEALSSAENGGDATPEVIEEKNARINELEAELAEVREENASLRNEVGELQQELTRRPDINERAVEAVEVLADEFNVGEGENDALRRKLQQARERIDELEDQQQRADAPLETDELENPKVQRYLSEMKGRVDDLDDYQEKMLWYWMVDGPDSNTEAYKYAGGSPTSSSARKKTSALVDTGLVRQIKQGKYDYGLPDHADAQLGEHFGDSVVDAVVRDLESYIEKQVSNTDD